MVLKFYEIWKSYGNWLSDGPNSVRFYLTLHSVRHTSQCEIWHVWCSVQTIYLGFFCCVLRRASYSVDTPEREWRCSVTPSDSLFAHYARRTDSIGHVLPCTVWTVPVPKTSVSSLQIIPLYYSFHKEWLFERLSSIHMKHLSHVSQGICI